MTAPHPGVEPWQPVGQTTLVECWRSLATLSTGAAVARSPHWVTAVFPDWFPLNNVLAERLPWGAAFAESLTALANEYARNGIDTWALWVPSRSTTFDAPDQIQLEQLDRDTTTLVMRAELDRHFGAHPGVRPTSVDCAARAGDGPLPARELAPEDSAPGLRAWVMVQDDLAVAGLWSMLWDHDCGIYGVGTAPAFRRRGLARALVAHALADAAARGARTASLQSTPMGQALYESLGFVAVGRYEEWLWNLP